MATSEQTWNFMDPASKPLVLDTLRSEIEATFELASPPDRWTAPTACEGWEVRDIIGHLVDATEGYLPAFDAARKGETSPEPLGLAAMPRLADEHAKSFRKLSQDEMLDRLRDAGQQAMAHYEGLSDDDWTGFMVTHPYMGPLPAMFYPMFSLVDYTVHSWDIREGLGRPHAMHGDACDLLVPVIYILWQATADTSKVTEPFSVGIRTSGHMGGDTVMSVTPDGVQFEPGAVESCDAVFEFDPATLILTGYGRLNGGTIRGDRAMATNFRGLFFPI